MTAQAWTKEPWERPDPQYLKSRTGRIHLFAEITRTDLDRACVCVNPMAGIEDPAALRKLLDDLRKWEKGYGRLLHGSTARTNALDTILDALFDLIPEPKDADDDADSTKT